MLYFSSKTGREETAGHKWENKVDHKERVVKMWTVFPWVKIRVSGIP
jgi:hypothetical protein